MALVTRDIYSDTDFSTVKISWNEIGKLAGRLAKIVKASETDYQLVGIAPKGVFVADQLSRIFDQRLAVLNYRITDIDNSSKLFINIASVEGIKNNILLINDRYEDESLLPIIVKKIQTDYPHAVIKVAVIWQYSDTPFKADFFVDKHDRSRNLEQPFDFPLLNAQVVKYTPTYKGNKLCTDWEQYLQLVNELAIKIFDSGWRFNHVISILRGGFYMGHALATKFNTSHTAICCSSYREEQGKVQSKLMISNIEIDPKADGRWLIVDDLVDSGQTLSEVMHMIHSRYPEVKCKTAVGWKKTGSSFQPDYYGDSVDKDIWIDQPFETPVNE